MKVGACDCRPARENRDRHEQRGQKHQPQTNAVDSQVIARADSSDPANILLEPELGRARTAHQQQRKSKGEGGYSQRYPLIVSLLLAGRKTVSHGDQRAENWKQDQDREQVLPHNSNEPSPGPERQSKQRSQSEPERRSK